MTRTQITENTQFAFKGASVIAIVCGLFFAGMKLERWVISVEDQGKDGSAAMKLAAENRDLLDELRKEMSEMTGELRSIRNLLAQNLAENHGG